MTSFKKIIACLDLSDLDQSIIKNTCKIAKASGTEEVIFFNVVREFNLPDSLKSEFPGLVEGAIEERKHGLEDNIDKYFDCDSIKKTLVVKQGNATKEILSFSVESEADLIVLGRRENSSSVLSTRIVRRAACNILLIPENTDIEFNKIHVPVDFSNYSDLSLDTALTLSSNSEAEIILQNVYTVPSSFRYSGKTFEEFAHIMEENATKDLKALVLGAGVSKQKLTSVHTMDNGQSVTKLIAEDAKKRNADLIVMGAKGRTAASALFLGSKAERMIQHNESIPLMVIREKGANAGILETLQDL